MSSFQTSLSSIRQRTEGTPWLPVLVGAAFGLLLGLLIGWVLWPVEWTNASLNDLAPEVRAEYLSAVADSYVVNGSEAARQQASQRLSALQGNLLTELQSARDYFSAHPNQENEIRVYNLTQLANALDGQANLAAAPVAAAPQAEALVASTPADGAVPVVILPAADTNAVSGAFDQSASGPSWLSRFMAFLGGLLLIGGGLYVFQRLRTGNHELWPQAIRKRVIGGGESRDDYSFDEEPEFSEASNSTVAASRISPWTNEDEPGERRSSGTSRYVPWLENPVDPDFGEDADDDTQQRPPATTTASSRSSQQVGAYTTEDEEAEVEFGEDEAEESERSTAILPYRASSSMTSPVNKPHYTEETETEEEDDWHQGDDQEEDEDHSPAQPSQPLARHRSWGENTPPRAEPAPQPVRPGSAPSPRNPGTKTLDSFECTYYTGMGEYDESFHIADPNSKRYIGECGMGVSTKNRLLHKNPDEVIALEVWLFDKADGSSLNTQMRILMSEYASDRYAEVFQKERNGEARPFVPQPGLSFQLECPSLILKGQVLEAEYTREGIFQKVKIRMDILRR